MPKPLLRKGIGGVHPRLIMVLGLLLSACSVPMVAPAPAGVDRPTPQVTSAPTGAGIQTPKSGSAGTGRSMPAPKSGTALPAAPTANAKTAKPTPSTAPALRLKILSPEPNAVVNVPQVNVTGQGTPGAVVTLNEAILIIDATGAFSVTLSLVEGPNLIEIEASDASGNGTYLELTVTYEPPG